MTPEEMLTLIQRANKPRFSDYLNLILGGAGLVGQGMQSSRAARQADENLLLQQAQDQYAREQQARAALTSRALGVQADDLNRATTTLDASPLAGELGFVQRQNLFGAALPQVQRIGQGLAGGPITNPFVGLSGDTYGANATARALADRRRVIAAVNPNATFSSLADYGLGDAGRAADVDVNKSLQEALARKNAQDAAVDALLQQQMAAAQAMAPQTQPQTAPAKQKKGGFWSKLGKIASVIAPIALAPFTGGASAALIGAGAGALGGVASGGGVKGALLGGAMGAIPVPGAGAAARGATETAAQAVKRAILNPASLAKIGGAAIGGPTEVVANMAVPFLPGMRPTPSGMPTITPQEMGPFANNGAPYVPGADSGRVLSNDVLLPPTPNAVAAANLSTLPRATAPAPMRDILRPAPSTPRAALPPVAWPPVAPSPVGGPQRSMVPTPPPPSRGPVPQLDALYGDLVRDTRPNALNARTIAAIAPAANTLAYGALAIPATGLALGEGGPVLAALLERLRGSGGTTTLGDLRAPATPRMPQLPAPRPQLALPAPSSVQAPAAPVTPLLPRPSFRMGPGTTTLPASGQPIPLGPGPTLTPEGASALWNMWKAGQIPAAQRAEVYNLLTKYLQMGGR